MDIDTDALLQLLIERATELHVAPPVTHKMEDGQTCVHQSADFADAWRGPTQVAALLAACVALDLMRPPDGLMMVADWPLPTLTAADLN
jgi:hypothetical protein